MTITTTTTTTTVATTTTRSRPRPSPSASARASEARASHRCGLTRWLAAVCDFVDVGFERGGQLVEVPRSALLELPSARLGIFVERQQQARGLRSIVLVRVTALWHTDGLGLLTMAPKHKVAVECLWKEDPPLTAAQVIADAGWGLAYTLSAMNARAATRTRGCGRIRLSRLAPLCRVPSVR